MTIEMTNGRFNERAWLLIYPSTTGMGSDSDQMLVSEKDLRKIIRREVEKKRNGARLWNDKSDVDPIMTGSVASRAKPSATAKTSKRSSWTSSEKEKPTAAHVPASTISCLFQGSSRFSTKNAG